MKKLLLLLVLITTVSGYGYANGNHAQNGHTHDGDTPAQGPKGDRGPQGAPGHQGEQGEQGIQGEKGDTGATGADGKDGATGASGSDGTNGLDGADGAKGDKGDKGTEADMTKVKTNTSLIQSNSTRLDSHDRRLGELEESKWLLETGIRVADGKHLSVILSNIYDWRHRRNHGFKMNFIIKLGQSYEETLLETLEKRLKVLEYYAHYPFSSQTLIVPVQK